MTRMPDRCAAQSSKDDKAHYAVAMVIRATRLLHLLDALRGRRRPVAGAQLAAALGVSLRTLYRDIATLRAQGADILGDPGVGYVLRPGFLLPALNFTEDELEALTLGARWVGRQADPELAQAAQRAVARITATLPGTLRASIETSGLLVPAAVPRNRPHRGCRSCVAASGSNTCCGWTTPMPKALPRNGGSGRSRWPFSAATA